MDQLKTLKDYLEASIKKHGNQPLTLQHLSNLIGVILREHEQQEERNQSIEQQIREEYEDNRWKSE